MKRNLFCQSKSTKNFGKIFSFHTYSHLGLVREFTVSYRGGEMVKSFWKWDATLLPSFPSPLLPFSVPSSFINHLLPQSRVIKYKFRVENACVLSDVPIDYDWLFDCWAELRFIPYQQFAAFHDDGPFDVGLR